MKLFILILLLTLVSCFNKKTPETYLIPDGYQGEIIIVYEQSNGREEEFEKNGRLYRIDTNGILITKFKHEDGILDQEYYYLKSDGSKIKIEIDSSIFWQDTMKVKEHNQINYNNILIRYFGVAGVYGGGTDFPKQVPYSESIIANGKFMDTTDFEIMEKKQWNIITNKLK